jgi:hypothetical protein
MKLSFHGRLLAAVAGCACAAGGLTILLGKDLMHPYDWASSQWITILAVFITIAAGHLLADAGFRHPLAAAGFLVMFGAGTYLVVTQSIGRQAENFEATTMSAEATNKAIADKSADLARAKARRDYADKAADREMTGQRCGTRCRDWRQNSKDISVVIGQLEKEIAALGPQKPVNAQAARMADMAAIFGFDRQKTVAAYTMLQPLMWCLFFEIGSIVSLGFAFRQGKRPVLIAANDCSVADSQQTSFFAELPDDPEPPKGKKPQLPKNVIDFAEHPVIKALTDAGGSVRSHRELAQLLHMDEGAASRRRQEVEDQLEITRVGKQLTIALKKTA